MTDPRIALTWPAEKFRRVFGAALVAASTDTDRPHLCAVSVRRANSTVFVEGTDGSWALRWKEVEGQTNEEGDPIDRTPFSCVIPRRVLESFLAATKKPLELERCVLTCQETPFKLGTILDVVSHEFLPVPEAFPPLDTVIPSYVEPTCSQIGVAAGMMARVARAFAMAVGFPDATVFWQFSGDALSPLVCTSPARPEIIAVIMPMRTDGGDSSLPEK